MKGQIDIYQGTEGTEIEVHFEGDTVWLNQAQMVDLFGKTKQNISLHINNCFKERELDPSSVVKESLTTAADGKKYKTKFYNLDVIISVGYRIKSIRGTQFRQWATQRLKDFLVKGYALNEKRLAQTQQEIQVLKSGMKILGRAIELRSQDEGYKWLDTYANGLKLLDDYDHEELDNTGLSQQPAIYPSRSQYQELIEEMKSEFESAVFGVEKDHGFDSAIHQIAQGVGDADLYPSLEEKAAMLLYLVVKNHAFADGNKRIAAACFLLFLKANDLLTNKLDYPIINNEALASLTLLVASSKPEEAETVKQLIMSVLNRNQ